MTVEAFFPRHTAESLFCDAKCCCVLIKSGRDLKSPSSNEDLMPSVKKEQQAAGHDHPRKFNFPQCHLHTSETLLQAYSLPTSSQTVVSQNPGLPDLSPQKRSIQYVINSTLLTTNYPVTAAAWNSNHSLPYYLPPNGFIPVEHKLLHINPYSCLLYLKYYITPFKLAGYR